MISKVESFLCPDKQVTPEEDRRIQRPKRCEKNNKDEENSPKTHTDKISLELFHSSTFLRIMFIFTLLFLRFFTHASMEYAQLLKRPARPIDGNVQPLYVIDLGVMSMKEYSSLSSSP